MLDRLYSNYSNHFCGRGFSLTDDPLSGRAMPGKSPTYGMNVSSYDCPNGHYKRLLGWLSYFTMKRLFKHFYDVGFFIRSKGVPSQYFMPFFQAIATAICCCMLRNKNRVAPIRGLFPIILNHRWCPKPFAINFLA